MNTALEHVEFLDSYKKLGVKDGAYSSFLTHLRSNPRLLAQVLAEGDVICPNSNVFPTVMSSLYGGTS